MFDRFRRKLAGVLSFSELAGRSLLYMGNRVHFVKDPDAIFIYQGIAGSQNVFKLWLEDHHAILHRIANCWSRTEQLLAVRRETLELVERVKRCVPLLPCKPYPNQFSLPDDDKSLLIAKMHPELSVQDAQMHYFQGWIYAEASCRCLRDISLAFGDLRENDWFAIYERFYGNYIQFCYENMAAEARKQIYPFQSAVEVFRGFTDDIKKEVLLGHNWEIDVNSLDSDSDDPTAKLDVPRM